MNYFDKQTERFFCDNYGQVSMLWINRKQKVYRYFDRKFNAKTEGEDGCRVKYKANKIDFYKFNELIKNIENNYKRVFSDTSETDKGYDISKELLIKGLRCELTFNELCQITQRFGSYEKASYYDFDLLIGGFKKFLAGEINLEYYTHWVMLWFVLTEFKIKNKKLAQIYSALAYNMDSESFIDEFDLKEENCNHWYNGSHIAILKNFNHNIQDALSGKKTDFDNNGVFIFTQPQVCCYAKNFSRYKVLIVDKNKKEFNFFYIDNPIFDEKINYDFLHDYKKLDGFDDEEDEYDEIIDEKIEQLIYDFSLDDNYILNPDINFNYLNKK